MSTRLLLPRTIGWGFYLACSWTWCIGMFLPVILIRDFGYISWIIFALPNIIGAAALPFVLSKKGLSENLTVNHKTACVCFSLVAIAFQFFFIGWMSFFIPKNVFLISFLILFIFWSLHLVMKRYLLTGSAFIWFFSFAALVVFFLNSAHSTIQNVQFFSFRKELIYLIPVIIFGFLLSPYLDLTFHKARQSNSSYNSKIAFLLGFCIFFLTMILFTFYYAKPLSAVINQQSFIMNTMFVIPGILGLHLIVQAGYTAVLHLECLIKEKEFKYQSILLSVIFLSFFISFLLPVDKLFFNTGLHELVYRMFIGFYGLIAPAYVWLCVFPVRKKNKDLYKKQLTVWGISVTLALPLFAAGFLASKTIFLLPGIGIILFSKLFVNKLSSSC